MFTDPLVSKLGGNKVKILIIYKVKEIRNNYNICNFTSMCDVSCYLSLYLLSLLIVLVTYNITNSYIKYNYNSINP